MARILRAFISYRRDDAFVQANDYSFIRKLTTALRAVGFLEVFVDVEIEGADEFTSRIREEINECDLFVALIGNKWLNILRERAARPGQDILVREIYAALKHEKEILPLLVDGAHMPYQHELPRGITQFHYRHAMTARSDDSSDAIASKLLPIVAKITRTRKLKVIWGAVYVTMALLAYFICAIGINLVGYYEYGLESWSRMAQIWSGFFIWPIICLPFALLALYRPLTLVFEFAADTLRFKERLTYTGPLLIGLVVTMLAVTVEIFGKYETPWTIYPTLPGCSDGYRGVALDNKILAKYDQEGNVKKDQQAEPQYGLENKCWPNVLFYLIQPRGQEGGDKAPSPDRSKVQQTFVKLLNRNSEAPYSWTFYAYVISFSMQIWIAATGLILAMFYVTVRIRRPQDGRILVLPSEDAYLCLTYAFITLVLWIPFRMHTLHFKNLYFCPTQTLCNLTYYQNDITLGLMFLICYLYLTVGLLRKFRRLALTVIGGAVVVAVVAAAVAIVRYGDAIAEMAEEWQFYLRFSILVVVLLAALWFQFNPNYIRRREDDADIA